MINYQTNLQNIDPSNLKGCFVDWPNSPSPEQLWEILNNSEFKAIAIHSSDNSKNLENKSSEKSQVVGFVAALSDNVLTVYVSLLEVLPQFQGLGIGKNLMSKMFDLTKDFYMIDLVCDENLSDFYAKFGMKKQIAMSKRNYQNQNGKSKS